MQTSPKAIAIRKRTPKPAGDETFLLRTLSEIARALAAGPGGQAILDLICRRAAESVHAAAAAIATQTPAGGWNIMARFARGGFPLTELELAECWTAGVEHPAGLRTHTVLSGPDRASGEAAGRSRKSAGGGCACAMAPWVVGPEAKGVLVVIDWAPRVWREAEAQGLHVFASQAALASASAQLDPELANYTLELEQRVKERTAEIRRHQAHIQTILDALGEGVVVTDLEARIEYVNRALEAMTGYAAKEAVGQTPRLWRSGQTPRTVYREMWRTILAGRIWRGELVNRRPDGGLFDADLTIAPIPSTEDPRRVVGFASAMRDVSLRRQAEADMRGALAQERELGELKSRFISMTSHEFRTPLATILSSAELLEHYGADWPVQRRTVHLQRIRAAVQRVTALMDDVLFLGRAEAGRIAFSPAPLDLVRFCRELIEEMQASAGRDHRLALRCGAAPIPAAMDEKLLRQILSNLLSNAIKYSPAGGAVTLTLAHDTDRVVFFVRDHGIGIPEADRTRLFDAFHRAGNVGSIPGTGLGLRIVKESVEIHGGTVEIASAVGGGTRVKVSLPLQRATPASLLPRGPAPRAPDEDSP